MNSSVMYSYARHDDDDFYFILFYKEKSKIKLAEGINICIKSKRRLRRIKTVKGLILACGGNYRNFQVRTLNEKIRQDKFYNKFNMKKQEKKERQIKG